MRDSRLLAVVALLLVVVLVARRWIRAPDRPPSSRRRWQLAAGAAMFTMALTMWVWGGLRAPAVVDDEAAYLLQADLFAHGRWTQRGPTPPESFTQPAVLVTPVLAPKMPPGHALLLAPGMFAGIPGLIPVLLSGLTAALLVLLVCEVQSPAVAALTVIIWLTFAGQMRWRASYFSEITTGMLWLLGWLALLRWRKTRRSGWLLLLAAAIGWGAVTRPLTMLAYAIPIGVVVLIDVIRGRHWRPLAGGVAVGVACLALLPIQNIAVVGDWKLSPLTLYTRQYMPYDVIGFGFRSTPPTLGLPEDLQESQLPIMNRHREHQLGALPGVLAVRLYELRRSTFDGWRAIWVPAAVVGLVLIGGAGWLAVATSMLLYLAYLIYAHEPHWTVYYLEATPIVAFVCATGAAALLARATNVVRALPVATALLVAVVVLAVAWPDLHTAKTFRAGAQRPFRRLQQAVADSGALRALVFVRYSTGHDPNVNLVRNVADPVNAPIVTAHELGAAVDARVIDEFPGRRVLYWDGTAMRLVAPPDGTLR